MHGVPVNAEPTLNSGCVRGTVALARTGAAESTSADWARCSSIAQRIARRWSSSPADADDLSQEALLRAFESLEGLRDPAALHGWLQVIVTRSVIRRVRIVRRKQSLTASGSDPEFSPSLAPLPDFQVDVRRLLDLLGSFPEEERRCFWLRRCEGLCIKEIAQETALSPSTIHRRLNVAERRLAKRLREPAHAAT